MRCVNRRFGPGVGVMTAVVMVWSLLATASPAAAGTFLSVTPTFPATVTVGQTGVATISITNVSSAPESSGTVALSDITLTPACGAWSPGDCPASVVVPNTLLVSQATGAAGTACAGVAFSITTVDAASGKLRLDPAAPVNLGTTVATATCRIDVTYKVLKRPSKDAMPGEPGVQAVALASATGTSNVSGMAATGTGSAPFTVNRATPSITTLAGPQPAAVGQAITDNATVTGVDGVAVPTSGIFFRVHADPPGAAPCSGPTQDLGLIGLSPVSTAPPVASATSEPVVAAAGVGTYRFVASYIGDVNYESLPFTACGEAGENVDVTVGFGTGRYTPLTPARILDTRFGTGGISGPVGPGASVSVPVAGLGGVPSTGATAVALNVTVTEPTADGYLTLSPTGQLRPLAANLNFTPNKTVPNLVVVALGTGGQVDLFNSAGATHVVFDVAGWFSADSNGNAGRFAPLVPARILDTRTGTGGSSVRLGPGASLDVMVAGQGVVPVMGASAVVMNVAVTNATAQSYLTVHPTGEPRPLAANLNWLAGETVSNRVIAKLGSFGRVTVYNPAGEVDIVVDVNGWFSDATLAPPGLYTPVTPARILDTRTGAGGGGPLAGGAALDVQFPGRAGLPPSGVSAVVFNVTAVAPAGDGYLTVYPAGSAPPLAADLNYAAGEIRPNLVVVKLDPAGRASLFTSSTSDFVIDVAGWFS